MAQIKIISDPSLIIKDKFINGYTRILFKISILKIWNRKGNKNILRDVIKTNNIFLNFKLKKCMIKIIII